MLRRRSKEPLENKKHKEEPSSRHEEIIDHDKMNTFHDDLEGPNIHLRPFRGSR